MTSIAESTMHYEEAVRLGKKEGGIPLILDEILEEKQLIQKTESDLGIIEIPLNRIVGTKTRGRSNSFSKSFYPLLESNSEFAAKWINLCSAHVEEGIRDPIKAYEFMNEFYVEEGNKRISVLRYFNAVSVRAKVIRIIPPYSNDKSSRLYYEFMDFYSLSQINDIYFSRLGSFAKLQRLVGKYPNEYWTEENRQKFHSVYARFVNEFNKLDINKKATVLPEDAFLTFIDLYDYDTLTKTDSKDLKKKMQKLKEEFLLLNSDQSVSLQMDPDSKASSTKKNLLLNFLPLESKPLRVAFIHHKNSVTSAWTYAHELGRNHLEDSFPEQIITSVYENVTSDSIISTLEEAIAAKNSIIFTTSPLFEKGSLKVALDHPEVKILNCSPNTSHKNIRTYYARMYEAKFLMGAIAGSLAENDNIGYIADYPIYGSVANVNAFAIGAKMVNPRAKIFLDWSKKINRDTQTWFDENNISIISGNDMARANSYDPCFGLYEQKDGNTWNIAMPVWNWGRFYAQMIYNILNGGWKYDEEKDITKGRHYWWGISTDIVYVLCSQRLPLGTARLVDLLRTSITKNNFNPFSGVMYSQNGIVQKDPDAELTPEEILTMDWLAENIVGSIPKKAELNAMGQKLSESLGLHPEVDLK